MANLHDLEEVVRKTKKRKVLGERCDMSVGVGTDRSQPIILMCQSRETKYIPEFGAFGLYLCEEHFEFEYNRRLNG